MELSQLLQYEAPILRSIIKHFESEGLSHNEAQLKSVDLYAARLADAYNRQLTQDEFMAEYHIEGEK